MKLNFIFEKETKGAVRYQEVTDFGEVAKGAQITVGTIYFRKDALAASGLGTPRAFTAELEFTK